MGGDVYHETWEIIILRNHQAAVSLCRPGQAEVPRFGLDTDDRTSELSPTQKKEWISVYADSFF